jgi:hypothetical protein
MKMRERVPMGESILALLQLFRGRVPDPETNGWVTDLAADPQKWPGAHDMFSRVRERLLNADAQNDYVGECQYCFEELCLKSLYNETDTRAPFDSDAPDFVASSAIHLARAVGVPVQDVIAVIAPEQKRR